MIQAALFGLNLWFVVVALPATRMGLSLGWKVGAVGMLPLVLLAYGLSRPSWWVLLALFPATLGLFPATVNPHVSPLLFVSASISLLGYLGAIGVQSTFAPELLPTERRPLGRPVSPRWRRRIRLFQILTLAGALFPGVLLAKVMFSFEASPAEVAAGRAGAFQCLALVLIGLVLLALIAVHFVGPMKGHLMSDREMAATVDNLWRRSRRGRPQRSFYLAVGIALLAMALLVWRSGAP